MRLVTIGLHNSGGTAESLSKAPFVPEWMKGFLLISMKGGA